MFEKTPYTPGMKKVLKLVMKEAERLGHDYIEPEHYMLGIIRMNQGLAVHALRNLRVDLDELKSDIEALFEKGKGLMSGHISPNSESMYILYLARNIAKQLNHDWIGTEHLILALIRAKDTIPSKCLRRYNVDFEKAQREIIGLIEGPSAGGPVGGQQEIERTITTTFKDTPFTPGVREVLKLSVKESGRLGHDSIEPEHYLLGIIRMNQGIAVHALRNLCVDLDELRNNIETLLPQGKGPMVGFFNPNSKSRRIIGLAKAIAKHLNHAWIGTEHLLLALIRTEDTISSKCLSHYNVDFEKAQREVIGIIEGHSPGGPVGMNEDV